MSKQPRKKQPAPPQQLSEQQIQAMGEIFPGFDTWYREHYKQPEQPPEPPREVQHE